MQKSVRVGSYWMYGKHAVMAAMNNPVRNIMRVLYTAQNQGILSYHLCNKSPYSDRIVQTTKSYIERFVGTGSVHQGIVAHVECIVQPTVQQLFTNSEYNPRVIILLDKISDPHNVGAIIRSAAAFGANAVITVQHGSPKENAVIAKVASGGLEKVPFIEVVNLSHAIQFLKEKGFWVFGLDHTACDDIGSSRLHQCDKVAFIFGAEEHGIRPLIKKNCDTILKIPIVQSQEIDSLNVSNAVAVTMYAYFSNHSVSCCI